MIEIESIQESTLTEAQLRAIVRLLYEVFVRDERTFEQVLENVREEMAQRIGTPGEATSLIIWENGEPVAHAGYFRREIFTETGPLSVAALWGVCVRESHRGQGLGAQIVRAYLDLIDQGEFPVGLWQTGVPEFYRKLGARIAHNLYINSQDPENPQADPWGAEERMIYPANYPWPEGLIDLNGPAY
ncbi:MAG TPA: GNAT family N-acetyltransferase [Anaerolineales bacterium]|nr:GNAT family N-acetyltransferase [Anaerolineales bacterium]